MAKSKNKPVDEAEVKPVFEPVVDDPEPVTVTEPAFVVFNSTGSGGVYLHPGVGFPGDKTIQFLGTIYATGDADEIAALRVCAERFGSVREGVDHGRD